MIIQNFNNSSGGNTTNIEHIYVQATEDNQTQFYINLETFNPEKDIVHIQSNGLTLFPGEDFVVSGNTIILAEGVPVGRDIGIYIYQNFTNNINGEIANLTSKIEITPIQLVAIEENQTFFALDTDYNIEKDFIKVDSGITSLFPGVDYNVSSNGITLNEGVPLGRTLGVYIYRNVNYPTEGTKITGSILEPGSIPSDRLTEKFLPLTGDVMSGPISFGSTTNHIGLSTDDSNAMFIRAEKNGEATALFINAPVNEDMTNTLSQWSNGTQYKIYGEHNKPYINDIIGGSNPNLLDNWHFTNPINQRNKYYIPAGTATCYTDIELTTVANGSVTGNRTVTIRGTNSNNVSYVGWTYEGVTYYAPATSAVKGYCDSGYTIDRWTKHAAGTVDVYNDYLLLKGDSTNYVNLRQYLEIDYSYGLIGKTVTLSVLTDQGLFTGTGVIPAVPSAETGIFYTPIGNYGGIWLRWYNNRTLFVQLRANMNYSLKYYAVKLELGSQQTLARYENGQWILNDPIPNRQQELTKCQRFYVGQPKSASWTVAIVTKGGYLMIPITLPVSLRHTSINYFTAQGGPMQIYAGAWTDISGISYSKQCTGNTLYLSASSSSYSNIITLEQGMTYLVRNVPDVSADL